MGDFQEQASKITTQLLRAEAGRRSSSIVLGHSSSQGGIVSLPSQCCLCTSSDLVPSWMFLGGELVG